jgi:hypothetical protein
MSLHWPKPSVNHVPEYQLSSLPYCVTIDNDAGNTNIKTGVIELPKVSRWIIVSPKNKDVNIYFVDDATADPPGTENLQHNNQFLTIKAGEVSPRLEIRCRKIYYSQVDDGVAGTGLSIIAGLINVNKQDGIDESVYDWVQ